MGVLCKRIDMIGEFFLQRRGTAVQPGVRQHFALALDMSIRCMLDFEHTIVSNIKLREAQLRLKPYVRTTEYVHDNTVAGLFSLVHSFHGSKALLSCSYIMMSRCLECW
jgi:hypothetical protein